MNIRTLGVAVLTIVGMAVVLTLWRITADRMLGGRAASSQRRKSSRRDEAVCPAPPTSPSARPPGGSAPRPAAPHTAASEACIPQPPEPSPARRSAEEIRWELGTLFELGRPQVVYLQTADGLSTDLLLTSAHRNGYRLLPPTADALPGELIFERTT